MPRRKTVVIVLGIAAALLIIVAAVVVVLLLTKSSKSDVAPQNETWKNYRLSNTTLPVHYNLTVHPEIPNGVFSGHVTIELNVSEKTSVIYLHIKWLNITSTRIFDQSGNNVSLKAFAFEPNEYWVVTTDAPLVPGTHFLAIEFSGSLTTGIVGFYRSSYIDKPTKTKRFLATTKFEPTFARRAFPCFDEPNKKASYQVTVIHDSAQPTALSNSPVLSTKILPSGLIETVFARTVRMSTYLVCFIISDFDHLEQMASNNVLVRTYAPADRINNTRFALNRAADVLVAYDEYFGIPYNHSFPKLDLVAIPDFVSGAMENWGVVTFRETNIILDPTTASAQNEFQIAKIVAHELAHMWFGDYVTMDWWSDLWLNEGFANFMAYLYGMEASVPHYNPESSFLTDQLQSTMVLDARLSTHPIIVPIAHPDDINAAFDSITYGKGSSVLRMLENYLGANNFKEGIRTYFRKYQYGNARTDDLWAVLSEQTGVHVKEVMDTWTKQGGYPVVFYDAASSSVRQKQFLSNSNDNVPAEQLWNVPIAYKIGSTPNMFLFKSKTQNVSINSTANLVKLNSDGKGFYRVNYKDDHWALIITALKSTNNTLTVMDRAQLIDDSFQLALANQLNYSIPLSMIDYLSSELSNSVPWSSAISNLAYVASMLQTYNTTATDKLRAKTSYLGSAVLEKLVWNATSGDFQRRLLRPLVMRLACRTADDSINPCRKSAYYMFSEWLKDSTNAIPSDYFEAVVRIGMAQTSLTDDQWSTVWSRYIVAGPVEKLALGRALADCYNQTFLQRLVAYIL
uniref:Aminopeptidase n=1 Tax=Plectus sambesii TaxID=2011161 RepID=A0A914WGZ3_9BILA